MGWSGSLTSSSAVNSAITYYSDTSTRNGYSVTSFKAPKAGLYLFQLYGSGGRHTWNETSDRIVCSTPGSGGYTKYYLAMTSGQVVYIGCGGPGSCAYVCNVWQNGLSESNKIHVHAVAGAGGGSSVITHDDFNHTGYNSINVNGGNGGGSLGGSPRTSRYAKDKTGADGGTQTGIGTYGGTKGSYGKGGIDTDYHWGGGWGAKVGCGGDGWYGGNAGVCSLVDWDDGGSHGAETTGGGGGSGYLYKSSVSYNGKTYTCSTSQGGGMSFDQNGKVSVTFIAAPAAAGAPTIIYPAGSGRTTYNRNARFKVTMGSNCAYCYFRIDSGGWSGVKVTSNTVYEIFSTNALSIGEHTVDIYCTSSDGVASNTVSTSFIVGYPQAAVSTGDLFDDVTIDGLQINIRNQQFYYGQTQTKFTECNYGDKSKADHLNEMNNAIAALPYPTTLANVSSTSIIGKDQINAIRSALLKA